MFMMPSQRETSFYKGLGKGQIQKTYFLGHVGSVFIYRQNVGVCLSGGLISALGWTQPVNRDTCTTPLIRACHVRLLLSSLPSQPLSTPYLKVGRQLSLGLRWLFFFFFVMVKTLIIYSQAWFIPSSSTNRILARTRHFLEAKDWSCQWRVLRFKPGIGCRRTRCRSKVALNYTSASLEPTEDRWRHICFFFSS